MILMIYNTQFALGFKANFWYITSLQIAYLLYCHFPKINFSCLCIPGTTPIYECKDKKCFVCLRSKLAKEWYFTFETQNHKIYQNKILQPKSWLGMVPSPAAKSTLQNNWLLFSLTTAIIYSICEIFGAVVCKAVNRPTLVEIRTYALNTN